MRYQKGGFLLFCLDFFAFVYLSETAACGFDGDCDERPL